MSELSSLTTSTTGAASLKGFAKGGQSAETTVDTFAALLDLNLDLDAAVEGEVTTGLVATTTAATDTAVEATPADDTAMADDPQALIAALVDALSALDTTLKSGETPDPALIAKLDETLDKLGDLLGLDVGDKTELLEAFGAAAGLAATTLAPALAPVLSAAVPLVTEALDGTEAPVTPALEKLVTKLDELAKNLEPTNATLAAKMAALADELGSGKVGADLMAKLGLDGAASADPELDAAIQALVVAKAPAQTVAVAQPFTPPSLTLPDKSALAAPAAGDAPPADEAAGDVDAGSAGDGGKTKSAAPAGATADRQQGSDSPPQQAPPAAAATAASSGQPGDTGATPALPASSAVAQVAAPAMVKAAHAAYQAPPINLPQLAFEMVRQVQNGTSRFEIRLDPPELGRIDVRMDVDAGGNLNARLTVERSETLDLLQRDQKTLERALVQAGIDGGKTNLEFSLKQNGSERQAGSPFDVPEFSGGPEAAADTAEVSSAITLYRGAASAGGVNIFV